MSVSSPDSVADLTQRNVEAIAELEAAANAQRTRGDVVADAIAGFCGRMTFVWVHVAWFGLWMVLNTVQGIKHIDSAPFQLLSLITSLEAIFLTTFVMISQNRLARMAVRRNHLDLQINLLAEQENSKMIAMLHSIMEKLGIDEDPEARALEEATQPGELLQQIQDLIEEETAAQPEEATSSRLIEAP